MRIRLLALLSTLAFVTIVSAAEGKWTPQQVLELDPKWLAAQGLELPPSRLWDPARGTGLLAATISTGSCSAGWVSPDGLFVTNHHCLFSMLQEHATPENDIITKGFLARTRDAELRSKTLRITVPRRFLDVTAEVMAAVPKDAADARRNTLVNRKMTEIVARCEETPGARCRVAAHDGGVQYVLQETAELSDVRLVYAPARAIGEFGGEIDNWMWPRHTGDFAIGRVYVDGKPFRPEFYFPIARTGVKPGDFVMTLGYPGSTYRALTAAEMEERHMWFTSRANVYREWIRLMETATEGSEEGRIAVAGTSKTLANRQKNGEGQLAGLRRGSILEKQRASDAAVLAWAAKNPSHAAAGAAHRELATVAAEQKRFFDHDFLLDHIRTSSTSVATTGPKLLSFAVTVAQSAQARAKAEADRPAAFRARNIDRIREQLEREQKNLYLPADKQLTADFVRRANALAADQRIPPLAALGSLDELYARTKIFDASERTKMLGESLEQLEARRDPAVDLGVALAEEVSRMMERKDRWDGAIIRLRPVWRRAVIAHAGSPVAPDGNGTLRVSFAHVKGYEPEDGLVASPQTTLDGLVAKHRDEEPFDVPQAILTAHKSRDLGRWKDARLGDVPVNFLADADTTGGNSGSPVINGRGELVGVNFDRVWENVANDFGYNPEVARNISVDIRYLLWILEEVEGAAALLEELGLGKKK